MCLLMGEVIILLRRTWIEVKQGGVVDIELDEHWYHACSIMVSYSK